MLELPMPGNGLLETVCLTGTEVRTHLVFDDEAGRFFRCKEMRCDTSSSTQCQCIYHRPLSRGNVDTCSRRYSVLTFYMLQ